MLFILYINYNNETLDTINITSPEDIKFDFKFYVKEHNEKYTLQEICKILKKL